LHGQNDQTGPDSGLAVHSCDPPARTTT